MNRFYKYFLLISLIFFSTRTILAQSPDTQLGNPMSANHQSFFRILYTGCGGEIAPVINAAYEQSVVELVNTKRWNNGNLPPLKRIDSLNNASRYHATDMGQDSYFSHDSYDRVNGNLEKVCGTGTRLENYYGNDWRWWGENIAAGYSSPASVMDAWMDSSGHRANILSTNNWEIGVGYFYTSDTNGYHHYWVQDFGRYANRYPVIINREAAITESRDVQLYIYGESTWDEMRLRNNDGAWSAWMPFQSNVNWQLDKVIGTQSVSVELRNGSSTATSTDEIYADLHPQLGGLPDSIGFLYSRATGEIVPVSYQLTPANLSTADTLAWQLSSQGNFFDLSATSGNTPQSFTVTPDTSYDIGTYSGSITVTVTNIADVIDSPCPMTVKLIVTDAPLKKVFLPLVFR